MNKDKQAFLRAAQEYVSLPAGTYLGRPERSSADRKTKIKGKPIKCRS